MSDTKLLILNTKMQTHQSHMQHWRTLTHQLYLDSVQSEQHCNKEEKKICFAISRAHTISLFILCVCVCVCLYSWRWAPTYAQMRMPVLMSQLMLFSLFLSPLHSLWAGLCYYGKSKPGQGCHSNEDGKGKDTTGCCWQGPLERKEEADGPEGGFEWMWC